MIRYGEIQARKKSKIWASNFVGGFGALVRYIERSYVCVCVCVWCSKLLVIEFNKVANTNVVQKVTQTYLFGRLARYLIFKHFKNLHTFIRFPLRCSLNVDNFGVHTHPSTAQHRTARFNCNFKPTYVKHSWTNPFSMLHNLLVIRIATIIVWRCEHFIHEC